MGGVCCAEWLKGELRDEFVTWLIELVVYSGCLIADSCDIVQNVELVGCESEGGGLW